MAQGDKFVAMYCRKKLNEGEEKGGREALCCCLSVQRSRKKSSSSKKRRDGGIGKRSGMVQQDSKDSYSPWTLDA